MANPIIVDGRNMFEPRIKNFKDWKLEMLKLAEKAVSENRLMNAAFYYRAAEFYVKSKDPEKEFLYDRFIWTRVIIYQ